MRARGWSGAVTFAAVGAALAIVVGAVVVQRAFFARPATPEPGMLASVDESLAQMPEVYSATEPGDVLPGVGSVEGPMPLPVLAAPAATAAPAGGPAAIAPTFAPTLVTRIPKPVLPGGPRRVGIQAGHWLTEQAPPELWRLIAQTGTSWGGVKEVEINVDIAYRIKAILEKQGLAVDVFPTMITPGYVADAFVALHGDGDGTGANSGFKMAFSARRTPYESDLLESIKSSYGAATGLSYDGQRISRAMSNYYVFGWQRSKYTTAPHTPSVILEMGYVSNDHDRDLLTDHSDVIASAIATGIVRFLDDHPREKLFGQDLLVPATPQFAPAPPRPGG